METDLVQMDAQAKACGYQKLFQTEQNLMVALIWSFWQ
jgi:hypothetical protein